MSLLVNPDESVLQSLTRLQNTADHDWVKVVEWFEKALKQLDTNNRRMKNDVDLRHAQGAAQALEAILINIAMARDNLEKAKARKSNKV